MWGLLVLLVVLLVGAMPVQADDDHPQWRITRYDVAANVDRTGLARVTIDFDFNFGTDAGHGPFLTLPLRQAVAGNPDVWRMIDIDITEVVSRSGAPAQVRTTTEDGNLVLRIGDPGRTVKGVQRYVVTYTARGLIAPTQASSGLDEVNWNAIGTGWQVPLDQVNVVVTGPSTVAKVACFQGRSFSSPCQATPLAATGTFTASGLRPGAGMQVVAGFPAGTFVGADPRFEKRLTPGNMFALTPLSGGLAAAIAGLGVLAVARMTRRGARDEAYLGLTPGVRPAPGQPVQLGRVDDRAPVTVQFTPPAGTRPGEVGTLLDATADNVDITATIIDLSVRGHFRITELGPGQWRFVHAGSPDPVTPAERHILATLFRHGPSVTTADLRDKAYHDLMPGTRKELYRRVTHELRWFRVSPLMSLTGAVVAGVGLIVVGLLLGAVLGYTVGLGLVGLGPIAAGVAVLVSSKKFGRRTAEGSAVLAESKGFELYLRTAEADQIKFEESIDVFSRYLPYAIVFGVAERWAKLFQQLAAAGRYQPDTTWYVGPHGYFYGSSFGHSLDNLSANLTSSMQASMQAQTAATAGSSGGSGFSGGGGFGGGGGGGW